ncbi:MULTISPECIES: BrxA/BrxB family bacilliredoxin [Brevibacillus]|jgi:putative YphP/YqiW family bacilliredoxin|uniref:BrxA/BrxB family bacilliredoxin n=2 Tax=Brevibacillus TaxID=55080 RepID=A0A3M8D1S9_9BACL|nr:MULTISPECIES: BrxA/BrxB family bacilliredoxin [Brevibacillus]MDR7319342.1 putative YphP/YqiW family bacilliredoxin [Brevibacillus nitrificans]MEC2128733.1 BrxA/BrxB family bacilliredoxin [Brevibacillus centrosporus]MED1953146.1 BrxA/BrxB family bacilliredoxin [Brevibacillus centrosporus]MED4910372.1 BrxA/BrxB family bacilliredoxin [Brevibacillus centrosporus]RNB71402.1 BrxA/BrxB family bacilliredoxin [Brevibacillus centrosporus]
MMSYEAYMSQVIQPMRDELTRNGFQELRTPEEVEQALPNAKGLTLVAVNSVCGCAAGLARPAVVHSLKHSTKPDNIFTVFAGQDKEATAKAREYFEGYPPSSPSFAILKDGKIMTMIERHQIENNDLQTIANLLTNAYETYGN